MSIEFSGIYLLQVYSCVILQNNTYKIGRSNNLKKRLNQYPNGSIVYFLIESEDIID